MKNYFKFGFLALAISLSVAACNSNQTEEAATDSVAVDTVAVDTVAVDSAAVDTAAAQ
jgi:ABC-type enterochelin transport system substrate-binding protein